MIGSTVSHFKVLDKLGEGGMGVVYKAHDLKLDRLVALKFLPTDVSEHGTERARFLQEARAASAINHPNVCVIYDIEEHEASPFIAMEYVEGMTLRRAIAESPEPLELDVVLGHAMQIAEALEQAHACGVVHRDIKSENVMVTPRGRIKVMDFGLAKLRGAAKLTKTSTTVGTLSYMAPEQLAGRPVDARADLFSFGVVLYEMVTGRLPFTGPGEAAVMYAIAHTAPEPIQKFRPGLSSEWLHVLDRALEKDPEDRYQSARDMLIDLRRLKRGAGKGPLGSLARPGTIAEPAAADAEPARAEALGKSPVASRAGRARVIWGGVGLVTIVLLLLLVSQFGTKGPPRISRNLSIRTLQLPQTQVGTPGFSPDGNWVAFPAQDQAGTWDLYFLNVHGGEPRRITSDSAAANWGADISPDGSQIVYCSEHARTGTWGWEIRRVPALGGASRLLATGGLFSRWRPDGERIGYIAFSNLSTSGRDEFWTVGAVGGDPQREFVDSASVRPMGAFDWSPDGRSIVWLRATGKDRSRLVIRRIGTGYERPLTGGDEEIWDVTWTRRNEIVFTSNRGGSPNLWIMSAQGGPAVQLTRGSGPDLSIRASSDGRRLLYLQRQAVSRLWISPLSAAVPEQAAPGDLPLGQLAVSPDGRLVAAVVEDPDPMKPDCRIEIFSRGAASRTRLTTRTGNYFRPAWSPDGRWLCYKWRPLDALSDTGFIVISSPIDGGESKTLCRGYKAWWRDAEHLIVNGEARTYLVPIDGGAPQPLSPESTFVGAFLGSGLAYYDDLRVGSRGGWVGNLAGGRLDGPVKRVLSVQEMGRVVSPGAFLLILRGGGEISKRLLPIGKDVRIRGRFTGLDQQSTVGVSPDGGTIAWTEQRIASKLVIVENLH